MEKVVVPQFVADWYEERKDKYTIHGLIVELNKSNKKDNEKIYIWRRSCQGRHINKLSNAQEVIAKMHLYGYEVERDKYYWRKKKEYLCDFEKHWDIYLNFDESDDSVRFSVNKFEGGYIQTKFTRVEVLNLVGEKDFDKLERVEITD